MTESAREVAEDLRRSNPELARIVDDLTNLLTVQQALDNTSNNPYMLKVREANDVALAATEAKLSLYFATKNK